MFKWLFVYWSNNVDSPSTDFKVNLWFYINARIFKLKLSNYIVYLVLNLNNLYFKSLKIFFKNNSFDFFYNKLIYVFFFLFIINSIL